MSLRSQRNLFHPKFKEASFSAVIFIGTLVNYSREEFISRPTQLDSIIFGCCIWCLFNKCSVSGKPHFLPFQASTFYHFDQYQSEGSGRCSQSYANPAKEHTPCSGLTHFLCAWSSQPCTQAVGKSEFHTWLSVYHICPRGRVLLVT